MDTRYSDQQIALRRELRDYFGRMVTPEQSTELAGAEGGETFRRILRQLGEDGMLTLGWPEEYGGRNYGAVEQLILFEEAWRVHAPFPLITLHSVAPSIMSFGTEEQKNTFLPMISRGECIMAIGYSEPGAGTDLASLRTSAEFDGENWVINGTKIWTSSAHDCQYVWLAARTDTGGKRPSDGITLFIVDASDPGFSFSHIETVAGVGTNVTYYDNVKVPPHRVVGKVNGGWKVITSQLNHERIVLAAMTVVAHKSFDHVLPLLQKPDVNGTRPIDDPLVAAKVGEAWAELQAMELVNLRMACMIDLNEIDVALASGAKFFNVLGMIEILHKLTELAGDDSAVSFRSPGALLDGHLEYDYRNAQVNTFGGGAMEVLRSMTATLALDMPYTIA
jgi:alkylation response protein AidB-like acyl-CoA dehydrogenase